MRSLTVTLLFLLIFISSSRGQDSTRFERVAYVLGASLGISLFDYEGYNLEKNHGAFANTAYRITYIAVQAALSYFLYKQLGLPSAISFNLIWWTWGDDLAYYGWAETLNSFAMEGRKHTGLEGNGIYWAWWTPIGLMRPKDSRIDKSALVAQAVIGFSVSLAILW